MDQIGNIGNNKGSINGIFEKIKNIGVKMRDLGALQQSADETPEITRDRSFGKQLYLHAKLSEFQESISRNQSIIETMKTAVRQVEDMSASGVLGREIAGKVKENLSNEKFGETRLFEEKELVELSVESGNAEEIKDGLKRIITSAGARNVELENRIENVSAALNNTADAKSASDVIKAITKSGILLDSHGNLDLSRLLNILNK